MSKNNEDITHECEKGEASCCGFDGGRGIVVLGLLTFLGIQRHEA